MTTDHQELQADERLPGVRLGLPAHGPGAVATYGRRIAGVLVDVVAAYVLAAAILGTAQPRGWSSVVFLVETVVMLSVAGRTLGMVAVRIHVLRLAGGRIGPWWAALRQLLLLTLIPALITDADRRGLHDKASGVVVVNS